MTAPFGRDGGGRGRAGTRGRGQAAGSPPLSLPASAGTGAETGRGRGGGVLGSLLRAPEIELLKFTMFETTWTNFRDILFVKFGFAV